MKLTKPAKRGCAVFTADLRVFRFVLCVRSGRYKASLEPRKVYRVLSDPEAERDSLLRVIDESGEDYLFPASLFLPIDLPAGAKAAFGRSPARSEISRPARRSSRTTMR